MDKITSYVLALVNVYLRNDISQELWESAEDRSYSRTAAKELYSRLTTSREPPLLVLERFRDTMDSYAILHSVAERIFSTAARTADYFIRCLI